MKTTVEDLLLSRNPPSIAAGLSQLSKTLRSGGAEKHRAESSAPRRRCVLFQTARAWEGSPCISKLPLFGRYVGPKGGRACSHGRLNLIRCDRRGCGTRGGGGRFFPRADFKVHAWRPLCCFVAGDGILCLLMFSGWDGMRSAMGINLSIPGAGARLLVLSDSTSTSSSTFHSQSFTSSATSVKPREQGYNISSKNSQKYNGASPPALNNSHLPESTPDPIPLPKQLHHNRRDKQRRPLSRWHPCHCIRHPLRHFPRHGHLLCRPQAPTTALFSHIQIHGASQLLRQARGRSA